MRVRERFERRIDEVKASTAYQSYLEARDQVWRMKQAECEKSSEFRPSSYWREELAGFDYMLDASPLIVEHLRHHTYHVTGLRTYDYRTGRAKARERFAHKLGALCELGGTDLLVPEAPELGGFGFEVDGQLYNIDTLKFFEALIALDRAGIIDDLKDGRPKRVLEIGGGWGGFAYQIKTLFPNVSYAIVDLPELFIFSATYLRTLFPQATLRYHPESAEAALATGNADFEFIPAYAIEAFRPPTLDVTINMVSFQEMTSAQVRRYVRHTTALGSRYLYSLNRDRSPYNTELSSVERILAESYLLREIELLNVPYTRMLPKSRPVRALRGRWRRSPSAYSSDNTYRHLVGSPHGTSTVAVGADFL